jgi:chromosome segregation ATPase
MRVQDHLLTAHRRECEERRRYVADLEHLAERLQGDAQRLSAEIQLAEVDSAAVIIRQLIDRQSKLGTSINEIGAQLAAARQALAAAEQQLRRHETVSITGPPAPGRAGRRRRRQSSEC